jgi:predicted nucleic acid-binding Zn ribbon protein
MKERIPQHRHCKQCGKAFVGDGEFCSEDCQHTGGDLLAKRKKQLIILYLITFVILILALLWGSV